MFAYLSKTDCTEPAEESPVVVRFPRFPTIPIIWVEMSPNGDNTRSKKDGDRFIFPPAPATKNKSVPFSNDVLVIGGGIVGLAVAWRLVSLFRVRPIVVEAEAQVAAHQSGHNSGVIHSGLYYRPGSLKARQCVEGREALYEFCRRREIPHQRCGKLVVATSPEEIGRLGELEERGRANGIEGLRRLDAHGIKEIEPHVEGLAGLHVPDTGVVDFRQVAGALAREVESSEGKVSTGTRVERVHRRADGFTVETSSGELRAGHLISCAGLQSDRVARMCGLNPDVSIVPFRGEYRQLKTDRRHLVRHLIYPVPDPRFPFLGVHFTRTIAGEVEVGPNALPAWSRAAYRHWSFSLRDTLDTATFSGSWKLARRYWATGLLEMRRSFSRNAFAASLRRMVPDLRAEDLEPAGTGVRAQAVDSDGRLIDDFKIVESERMLHVLNAPSPAATASLAIGRALADRAARLFGLQ